MQSSPPQNDSIDLLASATTGNLISLIEIARLRNLSLQELEEQIEQRFKITFDQIDTNEKAPQLYTLLYVELAPDELANNLRPESIEYLRSLSALSLPLNILHTFLPHPFFHQFKCDPIETITNYISATAQYWHLGHDIAKKRDARTAFEDEQISKNFLEKNLLATPVLKHVFVLIENLERYPGPLRFLSKLIYILSSTLLLLTGYLATCVASFYMFFIKDTVLNWLLNLQSGDLLNEILKIRATDKFSAVKKVFLNEARCLNEGYLTLPDEELIIAMGKAAVADEICATHAEFEEKHITNKIRLRIRPSGLTYLKLVGQAMLNKLFYAPLPESFSGKAVTIIAWPVRLITALPLFVIAAGVDLIEQLAKVTMYTLTSALLMTFSLELLILNSPLILKDTPNYLYRKFKSKPTYAVVEQEEVLEPDEVNDSVHANSHLQVSNLLGAPVNQHQPRTPSPIGGQRYSYSPTSSPLLGLSTLTRRKTSQPTQQAESEEPILSYRADII
jgi:hypothetical protein